jgi:hypothetical protein
VTVLVTFRKPVFLWNEITSLDYDYNEETIKETFIRWHK